MESNDTPYDSSAPPDPEAFDHIPEDPPAGYIPQTELEPGQQSVVVTRESDLILDAEDENPDDQPEEDGDADDDDDDGDDGEEAS